MSVSNTSSRKTQKTDAATESSINAKPTGSMRKPVVRPRPRSTELQHKLLMTVPSRSVSNLSVAPKPQYEMPIGKYHQDIRSMGMLTFPLKIKTGRSPEPMVLDIRMNSLGKNSRERLVEILPKNTTFYIEETPQKARFPKINAGKFTKKDAVDICKTLRNETTTSLYLYFEGIDIPAMSVLAEALQLSKKLTIINLQHCQLNDEHADHIAQIIEKNTVLKTLDLNHNNIGNNGAIIISRSLKKNTTLKSLHLAHNKIGPKGMKAIAEALMVLSDIESKFPPEPKTEEEKDIQRVVSRCASLALEINGVKDTKKNMLVVRAMDETGEHHNYVFLSAGLGGKHPRIEGGSASHTEQIWTGIQEEILADDKEVEYIYSINQACNRNPGSPGGCRTIPIADMGISSNGKFLYGTRYETAGKKGVLSPGKIRERSKDKLRRETSHDYVMNTQNLRGQELKRMKICDEAEKGKVEIIKKLPPATQGAKSFSIIHAKFV